MNLGTQEHYDMIAAFEKYIGKSPIRARLDKENKTEWTRGHIYQNTETNDLFNLYAAGYACARCVYIQGGYSE